MGKRLTEEEKAGRKYLPFKKDTSYIIRNKETGRLGKIRVIQYNEKWCYYTRDEETIIRRFGSANFAHLFAIVSKNVDDLIIRDYDVMEEIKKRELKEKGIKK